MSFLSTKKIIAGSVLIIALGAVLFWYLSSNQQTIGKDDFGHQQVTIPKVDAPEGWQIYTGKGTKWEAGDQKVAFAYPSTWTLNEEKRADGSLNALTLEGDGYSLRIDQAGRGMGRPYDYIRSIGGFDARTWKDETNLGTRFTFGITDINFIVHVTMQNKNQDALDKMLSSLTFYK